MHSLLRLTITALPLLLGCAAARAEIVAIAWTSGGTFQHTMSIAPSKFAEVCGALVPGQAIRWHFKADKPLDFNVHYHVGKDVVYPVRKDGASVLDGTLAVSRREEYCWMWTNPGAAAARVDLTMSR